MAYGSMVKISQNAITDGPIAKWISQEVRGEEHVIRCLPKSRRYGGRRLICPVCDKAVKTLYLPWDKDKFVCRQCYRLYFQRLLQGKTKGLVSKMKRQWPDEQY